MYEHWGTNSSGTQEPNNRGGSEFCAAANASQAYNGTWGWSDASCQLNNVSAMCRVAREWRAASQMPSPKPVGAAGQ